MHMAAHQLISVQPEDLQFQFELDKQSYCDLKVTNNTEHHVAFKVKTTSPKKYFVRPNTGVMHPWDSSLIRGVVIHSFNFEDVYFQQQIALITLQAQKEYPPNMQCKDKFLVQSTIVAPNTNVDELPPDMFTKEVGGSLQESKLRVIYVRKISEDFLNQNLDVQRLRDERDAAVKQSQQLQQDLELCKRSRGGKNKNGLTLKFALLVGLIGLAMGLLVNFLLSSPSTEVVAVTDSPF